MKRGVFTQRFHDGATRARDFARELVEEALPDTIRFRVLLNASYDGNPLHLDERVFPEDRGPAKACREEEVVDILWRDGAVPEWVNLSVIGVLDDATLVEVLTCGRFTSNDALLYHAREGRSPFHVLGPDLPVSYEDGKKFSIYERARCWSRQELEHLAPHRAKVWSLELHGDEFVDEALLALPALGKLELLRLTTSPISGPGMAELDRCPRLRVLSISLLPSVAAFSISRLPTLRRLEALTVDGLPAGAWGFVSLHERAPRLDTLTLSSRHPIVIDGEWPRRLGSLTVHAPRLDGAPLPKCVRSISIHLRESGDAGVERLLAPVASLAHLTLRGTPVSDALVEAVLSRHRKLEHLDLGDTRATEACIRRIAAQHPALRLYPHWR